MAIQSLNPATGEVLATFDEYTPEQTNDILTSTATAWKTWRTTTFAERAACLQRAATLLREQKTRLAETIALEMGKPIRQGSAEVEKCAAVCEYYAQEGEAMLAPQPVDGPGRKAYITFEPLGTVLTVMPWNYPLWQVFRIAAPSLMAGNGVVLKHASNVPQCALAIEQIFKDAGCLENIFRTLLIGARQVEAVLDHPSVFAVSLTGSEYAGQKVAAAAGARLKKTVMELGGSDPFIVMPDADLDEAVKVATHSRCGNTGQACIAAKRFIVFDTVYDAFVTRLEESMSRLVIGDPLDQATDMGPMSSTTLRAELQGQIDRCVEAGGTIRMGGATPKGPGAYYPPTIITDVPRTAAICQEEFFGPAALIFSVSSEEEALALANDTPFGLGGSIWSQDEESALAMTSEIRTGGVFVNGLVRSSLHLPFGGVGNSGYGRELGTYGIREFTNVKSVCVG
ncbi:NAD-dependent succinate-semialdehyde dehydrogenase [Pseudodesulfovibrio sediminis]|uniref:Succinate-semialdehyde dehydrogenase n=1 Tax=Pseudodesulfovibrio sediminis TaxID=2810563 RepID=A0ABN6ENZ4_9BACT|nr:NAD-dependent succinate-semialdehyde dehydrogenase [Pseudodesulfovibrio sediminis]BCS88062.1 succinate-semialdehyde dehydrogenase [Pseudodesulfovibrio sediminis]